MSSGAPETFKNKNDPFRGPVAFPFNGKNSILDKVYKLRECEYSKISSKFLMFFRYIPVHCLLVQARVPRFQGIGEPLVTDT